jgi:NodT family efflux transporter outer membrane factor (OMF) lipoprotein
MSDRRGRLSLLAASAGALLMAAACLVGPNFRRPEAPAAAGYRPNPSDAPSGEAAPPDQRIEPGESLPEEWWTLFRSSRLDETLRLALGANHTLAAARTTLAQARETIVEARAALYPRVDVGAGFRRGATGFGAPANLFSVGPSIGFSVDAFGGNRRQVEQATAVAERQRFELAAAYLTLTGDSVAQAITIAATRLQIATAEDLIHNDERNLDLVQRAYDAGRVARTDVLTAQAQLEGDRTLVPALRQQGNLARHALTVLVGKTPAEWSPPEFDMEEFTLPAMLPLTLPSELVRQRPDILAAEADLHADSAAIGVATAQMYPSITLSANLVQQSLALADLFRKASSVWSVGADASQPLSHGGALGAQRRAAIDAYRAQLELYEQTVAESFGQVADALSAIDEDSALFAASERAVGIAGAALTLQRAGYAAGKTSALQLIVAENTYSQARLGNARARAQRLQDSAQLFVALGGGWWKAGQI